MKKEKVGSNDAIEINYTVQNEEMYFITNIVDHEDFRTVHYIYWDYFEE